MASTVGFQGYVDGYVQDVVSALENWRTVSSEAGVSYDLIEDIERAIEEELNGFLQDDEYLLTNNKSFSH